MGVLIAIVLIYLAFKLHQGSGAMNKLKAMWFEAQYGDGRVIPPLTDCVRFPRGVAPGLYLTVMFRRRFRLQAGDECARVWVPEAFMGLSPEVQDAVLLMILRRGHVFPISISMIAESTCSDTLHSV